MKAIEVLEHFREFATREELRAFSYQSRLERAQRNKTTVPTALQMGALWSILFIH